ncbi:MAG: hypothetical protein IMX01_07735 [Limnochordaceae bacterium]|nr:hypothetical protein [Limnochordaceae bacterium]
MRWGLTLGIVALVVAATSLGAAAQSSVGLGLSVETPQIVGVYVDLEPMPGLLVQGNFGLNVKQQFNLTGFGIKGSYELIPAVAAVAGYTRYGDNNVIAVGARYVDRLQSLWGYAGINYQYVLETKKGNLGIEAGGKVGIWQNYFLGFEGGYRLMEDGTPNLAVYAGYSF